MKIATRVVALIGGASVLTVGLAGCSPARWEHADISQVAADGRTIETWEGANIQAMGPGAFSGGPAWVRFKTNDGKEVTITTPHVIRYR